MKIAYFVGSLEVPGGMERVVSLKANWLADHGYEVHIISFLGSSNSFYKLDKRIQIHTMRCIPIDQNHIKSFFIAFFKSRNLLQKILYRERYDIFIMAFPFLERFIASIDDGSKKIYEAHCAKDFLYSQIKRTTKTKFFRIMKYFSLYLKEKVINSKFDSIVVLTNQDLHARKIQHKGIVIPNPNTFVSSDVSKLDKPKVISVGRYSKEKGFDYLLKAWEIVELKHPDWFLDIYGADTGEKQNLMILLSELKIKNANLNDAVKDIKNKYLESSVYVLSSRNEGFPMVLTEAMTCGVPCVSFNCLTGPSDIINHGQDGYLIDNVGDYESLADYLCKLIEDENMRKVMGEKAIVNIQRFSMDKIMSIWCELFDRLIVD